MTGFVVLLTGCKKGNDVVYEPIPPTTTTLNPFGNYNPQMLTREELQQSKPIPAYRHAKWGLGMHLSKKQTLGGAFSIFMDIVEMSKMGYDLYHKSEQPNYQADFDTINNELQSINMELQQLSVQLDQLMAQLALTSVNIKAYMSSLAVQSYLTDLNSTYSGTLPTGLMFYAEMGQKVQHGQTTMTWTSLNNEFANTFVKNITANNQIENDIQGVHDAIVPDLMSLEGCLKDYTDYLILNPATNGNNQQVHNPANIMETYMLLENFFTTLINHQLQGLAILSNVYNYTDTTGATVGLYIENTFGPMISDEITAYLKTVNYMALNLFDHRSINQYVFDMKYRDYGIAPDTVLFNILARANFVANLYLYMINIEPSAICGNILVPSKYTDGSIPPVNSLTLNYSSKGSGSSAAAAIPLQATYPYTYWEKSGNGWAAAPDNIFHAFIYQLDTAFHPGSQRTTLSIANISGYTSPWYYQVPPTGYVDARYYNPRNPNYATSTTQRTDSNSMLFGYFSSRWIWGWHQLSMGSASNWALCNFTAGNYLWRCNRGPNVTNPTITSLLGDYFSNLGQNWSLTNQTPTTRWVHSINFSVQKELYTPSYGYQPVACSAYGQWIFLNPVSNNMVNFYSTIYATNSGIYRCGNSWVSIDPPDPWYNINDNIFGFANWSWNGSHLIFPMGPIKASFLNPVQVTAGQAYPLMIDCEMAFADLTKKSATFDWNLQPMFTNTYNIFN